MGLMLKNLFAVTPIRATALAAAFTTALIATPVRAQERLAPAGGTQTLTDGTRPVVVLSVASINKLTADITHVTGLAGQPQFGGMFAMMAGMYAQGTDMNRPIAVLVPLVGGMPRPIVMVPTSDIRAILKRIETQTGPVDELDDGTLVVTINRNTLFIKQNGNTAVAAQSKDVLDLAPADASGMLQGMGNNYDIAVRLQIQQIPLDIRNVLIAQMRQGFEQAMANQPDNESAREMAEGSIAQVEQLVREADELFFGVNINKQEQHIGMDFSFTAVPGTELASMYGGQQPIPSRFASVIRDDAAAYIHSATSISPEAIEKGKESLGNVVTMVRGALAQNNMPEQQVAEVEQFLSRFIEIVTKSIEEGKGDMGLMVKAGTNEFKAVMGTFVADGSEVATLAKDLAAKIGDNPKAPKFTFDAAKFGDVTMHLIEADIPANEDEAQTLFGDKIRVHIGTAPKAVYFAIGRDSESMLKSFITAGSANDSGNRPLGQFKMKLLPFLELAQSVEANDDLAAVISALNASEDKGAISFVNDSIPNGAKVNFRIGESLIQAIGAATAAKQQGQF